jgi:hypothetical protein
MNYQKVYDSLIEKAKVRISLEGYFESHHIVPKSMNGTDDENNLVNLTAREHFVAHYLLAKIYGGHQWRPLLYWKSINSKVYELARIEVSKLMKSKEPWNKGDTGGTWSEKRKEAQKHVVHPGLSEETKLKHRKPKSKEHAENIRKAKLNQTDETKAKIGAAHKGRTASPETVQKMRLAKLGKPSASKGKRRKPLTNEHRLKVGFGLKAARLNRLIDSIFTQGV